MSEEFIYTEKELKPVKIFIIALAISMILFNIFLLIMARNSAAINPKQDSDFDILHYFPIFMAAISFVLSEFLGDRILDGRIVISGRFGEPATPFMKYRRYVIINLSLVALGIILMGLPRLIDSSRAGKNPFISACFAFLIPFLFKANNIYPGVSHFKKILKKMNL